jgi:hypothetical protein
LGTMTQRTEPRPSVISPSLEIFHLFTDPQQLDLSRICRSRDCLGVLVSWQWLVKNSLSLDALSSQPPPTVRRETSTESQSTIKGPSTALCKVRIAGSAFTQDALSVLHRPFRICSCPYIPESDLMAQSATSRMCQKVRESQLMVSNWGFTTSSRG